MHKKRAHLAQSGLAQAIIGSWVAVALLSPASIAQSINYSESFRGTTADGWVFGTLESNDTKPYLTANTIDSPGDGWLRLTVNNDYEATYALLDTQIFSVNAQIEIEMTYAFYNSDGVGADGITFFMVDGDVDFSSFDPGAFGGALGYAQMDSTGGSNPNMSGMIGGYLGFGFDNYGNFASTAEGHSGGLGTGLYPNRISVRGPDEGDRTSPYTNGWDFIDASDALPQSMDFPTYTTRPNQTTEYRSFKLTIDANNQLTVLMKFGTGDYITAFTSDLSAYERPDTFKIGFTGSTGGVNEIQEVRDISVTITPWQTGSNAFEWDDGDNSNNGGAPCDCGSNPLASGTDNDGDNWSTAANWVGNSVPTADADILFGDAPSSNPQTVTVDTARQVRSLTFDTPYNYTLSGSTITLGNTSQEGLPSINVNNYNDSNARHTISNALALNEDVRVRNYSLSTLTLAGAIDTNGNDITVNGGGAVNFNGIISEGGAFIKNGTGITTLNATNTYTGATTINEGMLIVTANGALGGTGSGTTVASGATLGFRSEGTALEYLANEAVRINGQGIARGGTTPVGALYNDSGDNTFAGAITLGSNSAVGSREGNLTLSGAISDGTATYSLTKLGAGVVTLSNSGNNWGGGTIISDGALRIITNAGALSTNSNLQLNGGVLEIGVDMNGGGTGDFSQNLGTGAGQVQWTGDGGFSAYGANRTVRLNNGTGNVTWASTADFVGNGYVLLLSSDYSNATITLANAISFNGAQREIRVADGSAAVDAVLSGRLRGGNNGTGTGGLIKTGEGTLNLSYNSATNTSDYSGATEIRGGALRISNSDAFSNNSNFQLNGGVFEIGYTTTYAQGLGTGGGNIRWLGDGGFSAAGSDVTVNIGGAGATLIWGSTANFVGADNKLIFGSSSATNTLTFANAIGLNNGSRTIRVNNGTAAQDAILSGAVGTDHDVGSLTVEGTGRLDSTAANKLEGTVTVSGAEFRLQGAGRMASISGLTVDSGGTFTLDNSATDNTDRIGDGAPVTLNGGTLSFLGRTNANSSETINNTLTLAGGANTINIQPGTTAYSAQLTFSSLSRQGTATLNLVNNATGGDPYAASGTNPMLNFSSAPSAVNGIIPYITVAGADFAAPSSGYLIPYTGYVTTAQTGWTSTTNAAPSSDANATLSANRSVNSLKLTSGRNLTEAGYTLNIGSGGLISTGANASTISGGTLTAGGSTANSQLIAHVYNTGGLQVSSVIADNAGGAVNLVKTGTGTMTLSGTSANTFTGTTTVLDGTLVLDKTAGVNAIAGNVVVGDGSGTDTLRINAHEQIANTATVTLNGSEFGKGTIELNSGTTSGVTETFASLVVNGDSVLDFQGGSSGSPNFLQIDSLSIASGATLTIVNWTEYVDFLLIDSTSASSLDSLSRVIFQGYQNGAQWTTFDGCYWMVSPVPEPSTYGAILMGLLGAAALWRRSRKTGELQG